MRAAETAVGSEVSASTGDACAPAYDAHSRPHGVSGIDLATATAYLAAQAAEIVRLTDALHANRCHPDFEYWITTGGSPAPPSTSWGNWEPNVESPEHGRGAKPAETRWEWRRRRSDEAMP